MNNEVALWEGRSVGGGARSICGSQQRRSNRENFLLLPMPKCIHGTGTLPHLQRTQNFRESIRICRSGGHFDRRGAYRLRGTCEMVDLWRVCKGWLTGGLAGASKGHRRGAEVHGSGHEAPLQPATALPNDTRTVQGRALSLSLSSRRLPRHSRASSEHPPTHQPQPTNPDYRLPGSLPSPPAQSFRTHFTLLLTTSGRS